MPYPPHVLVPDSPGASGSRVHERLGQQRSNRGSDKLTDWTPVLGCELQGIGSLLAGHVNRRVADLRLELAQQRGVHATRDGCERFGPVVQAPDDSAAGEVVRFFGAVRVGLKKHSTLEKLRHS